MREKSNFTTKLFVMIMQGFFTVIVVAVCYYFVRSVFNGFKQQIPSYSSLFNFKIDLDEVANRARIETLNHKRPDFVYLSDFIKSKNKISKYQLTLYRDYFKKVTEYMPRMADAWGMLGYCYYQLNDVNNARNSYLKAIEINPSFFWFQYNLGIIYYELEDYQKGSIYFKNATASNFKATLEFIYQSKYIYLPFLTRAGINLEKYFVDMYQRDIENCFKLLILSKAKTMFSSEVKEASKYAISIGLKDEKFYWYYLALSCSNLNDLSNSLNFFTKYLQYDPDNPDVYKHMASIMGRLGNEQGAKSFLKKHIELMQAGKTNEIETQQFNLEVY